MVYRLEQCTLVVCTLEECSRIVVVVDNNWLVFGTLDYKLEEEDYNKLEEEYKLEEYNKLVEEYKLEEHNKLEGCCM